ncbi:Z-ring-associated protein [Staphylococcus hyicus]|uniref:Cell division protein ZapA n=1 Tax=Staphylococcus aureus TaxID=1280 RepID=A0A380DNW5_STAAU|nr:Z-ring-associated protein [Staphylococcus aureus]VTS47053.1 Z-ring-associated protein [Staphylococcus hyicus]SUK40698.1 Z-ring-associated protein [Staphylococcus aureus]SUK51520.1 Z-ring-associated protein [Staphylococcus aureus]SUK81973.1 Z-ring-associated protein [Staphylococcus aureus]
MAQFKNKVNVSINDQLFTIVGEDNPEHIRYVAHLVDDKIKELGYKAVGLDTSRKAILTAVNIMHEKVLLEEENRRLKQQIHKLQQREQ